jgi:hypothetical protein
MKYVLREIAHSHSNNHSYDRHNLVPYSTIHSRDKVPPRHPAQSNSYTATTSTGRWNEMSVLYPQRCHTNSENIHVLIPASSTHSHTSLQLYVQSLSVACDTSRITSVPRATTLLDYIAALSRITF